jgi:hypothetical protein
MCKDVEPIVVMDFLNSLYKKFDELSDIYGVYKVSAHWDKVFIRFADEDKLLICLETLEGG